MISIIVSSYKEDFFAAFTTNVEKTIGVAYEIIRIHNPGKMGICEAYNTGAMQANYDYLCFSHEDVCFNTQDWGKIVQGVFDNNSKAGLLGVAGSKYKPFIPSGWSHPYADHPNFSCMNMIQTYKDKSRGSNHIISKPLDEDVSPVVSVDGVFFCTRKSIVQELVFDQVTFQGFHCYDVDISLQIFERYQVLVTYDILIEHFSEGSFDKSWIDATLSLHTKWGKKLPLTTAVISRQKQKAEEYNAFLFLYMISNKLGYNLKKVHAHLFRNNRKLIQVMGLKNFLKMHSKLLLSYIKPVK